MKNHKNQSTCKNLKSVVSFFTALAANLQLFFALLAHTQVSAILQNEVAQLIMASETDP
jgi:hypothetical protein